MQDFVYMEVGCNKGTDAVLNLRAFTAAEEVSIEKWQSTINMSNYVCAFDEDRWRTVSQRRTRATNNYKHFCIEAAAENVNPVSAAADVLGYRELGLIVHHAAVSSSSMPSTVKFPVIPPGGESVGIDTDHSTFTEFSEVRVVTVDGFVAENGINRVDVLKIDTEGNDPLVIIGSTNTLAHFKPSYVQFENHGVGRWATFQLKDVIDLLDSLSYECFWATDTGKLFRITSCWSGYYMQMKNWSNVACHHRSDLALGKVMKEFVWR